ncbi:MAG: CARDB domain-containing protein, partial [Promethearchaeota archaeon]
TDQDLINYKNSENTFIYTLNGKQFLAEYITREKVEEMKKDGLFEETEINYNDIIDGHGTGYSKPTEEDLDSLVGKLSLLGLVSDYKQGYKATADISTEIYFPVVGDQGWQGSCTSWANVYYAFGYLEAKDYGWDASSGDPRYLLSPAWSYNKIAAYDYGSVPSETAELIKQWGVATLNTMPYDDTDVNSWGDEAAWREAPYHKPLDYTLITYIGYTTIDAIKSLLDIGTPVTFGIDASQFYNGLDDYTGDYILSSSEYDNSSSLNHAQCFVGYDDSISEGSDVGAFRVVNSWGGDWMDNGFYWLTYDALHKFGAVGSQQIIFLTDRIDYSPDLIAIWEFNPGSTRMGDILTLGVGPHDSPLNSTTPHYDYDENNLFPEFMAFDISDFYSYYVANNDVFFYLEIGPSHTNGTISSFKLERYVGGILQEISQESPDVPEDTPGYVNATFMIFNHELKTILKAPTNPSIYNSYQIEALVINNGANNETNVDFDLLLNNIPVHSINIPDLPSGSNITTSYMWTPAQYDIYNITAYVTPVPGEIYLTNNHDTEILYILGPIFYDNFESGLSKWISITGLWHLTNSSSIWPNPYHSPIHSMWFGNESAGTFETGFQEVGDLISNSINLTNIGLAFLEFYHWRQGEGGPYDISFVYISIDGINWNLLYQNSESYVNPWEKVSIDISAYTGNASVQIMFRFNTIDEYYNYYRGWLIDDVAVMGTDVEIPHDLRVSLEVPKNPELFNTYTVNATITNTGTNDESDVDFFLYLDDVVVDSINIANFPSGSSNTVNYLWTPTHYGEYNFTAYTPSVPGEEFIYNNFATEILPVHEIILFDGMYINYTYSMNSYIGPTQVSYTHISESIFHVVWDGIISGIPVISYWDVDAQTRIMENGGGNLYFGNGYCTPIWIFTDVSLGDIVPIAVDGEGEHYFNVSGDSIYDVPDFGSVEVWILEDLTFPGGIAWYEKNTGILLNGTFLYAGGLANYTFEYVESNAFVPKCFILSTNAGSPDTDGTFNLIWEESVFAINYTVYQYTSYITEINNSLTVLADGITDLNFVLSGYLDGTYYFIVVAHNDYGTTKSNCIKVVVQQQQDEINLYIIIGITGAAAVGIAAAVIIIVKRKNRKV